MSHYKPYPVYKEPDVEWLEKIPEHWSVVPFKWLAVIQNGKDYKDVEASDGGVPVIGSGGEFARASQHLFCGESILLGRKGTIDRPLYINGAFWTVDTMFYTVIGPKAFGKYLYYCALTIQFERYSTNTALPSMTQEVLGQIPFATPAVQEQRAIVAHLDRETTRIDALISKKTRFIELLREKRQALITQAVTKGLDPNVKMKDSGVEWLGDVPAHWTIKRLMHLTAYGRDIMYGIVLPGPNVEGGIAIVKGGDVKPSRLIIDTLNRTTAEIEAPYARARLLPNDIVYSIRGSIGEAELVPEALMGANITQDVARISPSASIDPIWLQFAVKCTSFFSQLEANVTGATIKGINIFDLKRAVVAVPPSIEQLEIAAHLNLQLERLDRLTRGSVRSIELLKERRSALITAAVTGQIDLREAA